MEGWELRRLGDLCAFDKTQGIHTNLPYVGLEHIESGTSQFLGSIEPTDVKSSTFKFNNSHVLYGRLRPYLNKVLLPDFEGHCSTEIFPIQVKPGLLREYLCHWLMSESVVESINATCTGARMPRADMNEVLNFNIPVPSEQRQHRIVTLLDEAFADIATAKANAEKNLQNARELFTRISGSVLSQYASTSQSITLEDLVEPDCSLSYGIVQPGDEVPEGLHIVRPVDMNTDVVMLEGLKRINPALANSYARTTLKGNDILLCVRGTTGTVALTHSELAGANVTRGIVPIRFAPEKISHQFGYYLLRSEPAQLQIQAKTYGTALQQINIRDLRQLTLPVPAQQDQEIIVKRLSALEEETKQLTAAYENKLTALDDLKKSLLHQAFSGQL